MALPPERYDHFKNWFQRNECFSKASSTFRSGKIYLICILCTYETPITSQGNSWNIGHFKRHLKASPNCDVNNTPVETIQMDTAYGLQVSMTLDFITFITFNETSPKLEPAFCFQLSTHCKLIIFVLLLFHQLNDGDGLDFEATRDSTLGSSSEMIIEVSLTTVGNIAAVMMVLAKNFHKISIHSVGN
jgi:hypothetical protein